MIGMAKTLEAGDSLKWQINFAGLRRAASDVRNAYWLGPLPGRYRLVVSTEGERRKWQHWRGGREVRLVSRPFELGPP